MAKPYIPYSGPIVTRNFARENNLLRFFEAEPCKYGHISERYVKKQLCLECRRQKAICYRSRNKEKVLAAGRKWKKDNKDRWLYKQRKIYALNRTEHIAITRKWQKDNKEKVVVIKANRRARERNAEGYFDHPFICGLLEEQNNQCVYCKRNISTSYHIDHILPLVLGGSNWPSNIQLLCPSCNVRKGAKHPEEWNLIYHNYIS